MEICVQIIDINPSISQLKTNKNDIISLILFDDETSEVIINLDKFIQKKDTLNFIVKNIDNNNSIKIKCTLVLNIKDILGVSEFLPKSNGIDLIQVNFVTNITEGNKITKQIYNTIQLIIKTDIKFRVGKSLIKTNSQKYFKKSFSLYQKINNINNLNNKKNNKKNENINNNWKKYCLLTDQNSSISSISCNNELNLWASITNDGYICLYTLPLCNLIRVIKAQSKLYSYIFLSDSPLPCIIAISDDDNSEISVYSINGKLIFKKQEYNRVSSPIIIKDLNSNDHLIFIGNNNITIMSLPDLNIETNFENLIGINSICISEDNKTLYAINKSRNETYIIKEDSKIKLLSSILHN